MTEKTAEEWLRAAVRNIVNLQVNDSVVTPDLIDRIDAQFYMALNNCGQQQKSLKSKILTLREEFQAIHTAPRMDRQIRAEAFSGLFNISASTAKHVADNVDPEAAFEIFLAQLGF